MSGSSVSVPVALGYLLIKPKIIVRNGVRWNLAVIAKKPNVTI
jgi:hypothetical protein